MTAKGLPAAYRNGFERTRGGHLTQEQVIYQNQYLLTNYVEEQMQRDGIQHDEDLGQQQQTPQSRAQSMEYMREVIRSITTAVDVDVKSRETVDSLISRIPPDEEGKTLGGVISKLFESGITWGRVVSLFYFAYRLCVKAIKHVGSILKVVLDFMTDRLVPWIIGEGGWEMLIGYVGLSSDQFGTLLLGGAAVAAGVVIYYKFFG